MKKVQNSKSVDVCINVYGKPWQTLCTLKSLMQHSGHHIDKIYLVREHHQPYHEKIDFIFKFFQNLIVFTPVRYEFWSESTDLIDEEQRHTIRYQYGIEKSDKKYIFLTHNDVLYTGDVISDMLNQAEGMAGVGQIGQCWNCPANHAGLCSSEKFYEWQPSYEDVISLPLPFSRTTKDLIDPQYPMPLPECRLNEWACLLNREILIKEQDYQDRNSIFGIANKIDIGCSWFKFMTIKKYQFLNYNQKFDHGYWAKNAGHVALIDEVLYRTSERAAKKYFYTHYSTTPKWIKFLIG